MNKATYSDARNYDEAEDFDDEPQYVAPLPPRRPLPPQAEAELGDDEWDEVEEPRGLFSTPGRAIALGSSVLMMVLVFGVVAWLIGTKPPNQVPPNLPQNAKIGININDIAPDFTLNDVHTGQPIKLSSLRGKPTWINFWGTWCPPCRAEMPEMQKMYDKYHDQVNIVGISMAPRDEPVGVKNFVDAAKYPWQFIHDGDYSVATTYQIMSVPTSLFIDKSGVIRSVSIGGIDSPRMEKELAKARN